MAFSDLIATMDAAVHTHLGGVDVVYQPDAGDAVTVQGIFDENYILLEGGENGVEQIGPAVSLVLADLPVDPEDDEPTITIGGNAYRVRERHPDSIRGRIVLMLMRSDL